MANTSCLSRRSWLAATTGFAAGSLIRGSAVASEPIANRTAPKFKLSLAAYSYRNLLKDPQSGVTL